MNPLLPSIISPKSIDLAVMPLRTAIETVPWINFCAGVATPTLRISSDSRRYVEPTIYDGNVGDMVSVMPNDLWEPGFAFIDAQREFSVVQNTGRLRVFSTEINVIVYVNLQSAYNDYSAGRTVNHAISDVSDAVMQVTLQNYVRWRLVSVTSNPSRVYSGYGAKRVKAHLLNMPRACFKITLEMRFNESQCT